MIGHTYLLAEDPHSCPACDYGRRLLTEKITSESRGTLLRLLADHQANAADARRWSAGVWRRLRAPSGALP